MSIPDYQSILLPILKYAGDRKEHTLRDGMEAMAGEFTLSPEERRELLPSGHQPIFTNRVGWARTYLYKAGLLSTPCRGAFLITEQGLAVLGKKPKAIDVAFLEQFPAFVEFKTLRKPKDEAKTMEGTAGGTPEEVLEGAFQSLNAGLAGDLLAQIKNGSPGMFERTVVELLVKMGYGGSLKDAGKAVGQSGDEGIDGIIKEDHLGLDVIYVQAKRGENPVGRPEIQKFAGALQGKRARKGIFVTTSTFTADAHDYAERIESKIVLIDGLHLAHLMIEHGIGVSPVATYAVKRIDSDYFSEEQ